jgi:hypothetical protein
VDEGTLVLLGLSAYLILLTLPLEDEVLISLMLRKSNAVCQHFISINLFLLVFKEALMYQVERGLD